MAEAGLWETFTPWSLNICTSSLVSHTAWAVSYTHLTMDEKAIRRFLDVTHERYFQELGDDFGTEIRSIFTDEPQTTHMGMARTPFERKPIIMPYTRCV